VDETGENVTEVAIGLTIDQLEQAAKTIEWVTTLHQTSTERGGKAYFDAVRLYDPEGGEFFGWVAWVGEDDWRYFAALA